VILYWSDSPWPSLWSVRPDGSNRRRAYRSHQNAKRPSASPGGRWIAFDGAPPETPPLTEFDIQVVGTDGSGLRSLTSSHAVQIDARWSPDGSTLAFTSWPANSDWRHSTIWTVGFEGGNLRRLGRGQAARWSPDGRRLVFDVTTEGDDGDLFVMDADGSHRQRLLAAPGIDQAAAWSPNGTRILFTRFEDAGRSDVFLADVAGTHVCRLTGLGDAIAGSWSPDGSRIVFTSVLDGRSTVHVMDADGSHRRPVPGGTTEEFDPSWGP